MPLYPGTFQGLKDLEREQQYAKVFALLDEAESDGVFERQPDYDAKIPPTEDPMERELGSRNRTLRTRLSLLGYRNLSVRIAAQRFHRDCGTVLQIDSNGVVGPETWDALDALLSFELVRSFDRWFDGDRACDALVRAVEARLHAVGLLGNPNPPFSDPGSSNSLHAQDRRNALTHFIRIATHLGIATGGAASVTPAMVAALFGQDGIVERLAASTPLPGDPQFTAFAASVARIELWLLGYPTAPDAPATFRDAHWAFLFDAGRDVAQATMEIDAPLTPSFFRLLLNFSSEEKGEDADGDAAAELRERIENEREPGRIWTEMERVGSTMWDGLRRAWQWFKRLVAGAIRSVVAGIRNLARLAYHLARGGFAIVKRALTVARDAIRYVLSDTFPGSDRDHIVIGRNRNFDVRVYMATTANPRQVDTFIADLTRNTKVFSIALAAFGALVDYIRAAANFAAFGWFSLVMALLRLRGNLAVFARFLELGREPAPA